MAGMYLSTVEEELLPYVTTIEEIFVVKGFFCSGDRFRFK